MAALGGLQWRFFSGRPQYRLLPEPSYRQMGSLRENRKGMTTTGQSSRGLKRLRITKVVSVGISMNSPAVRKVIKLSRVDSSESPSLVLGSFPEIRAFNRSFLSSGFSRLLLIRSSATFFMWAICFQYFPFSPKGR